MVGKKDKFFQKTVKCLKNIDKRSDVYMNVFKNYLRSKKQFTWRFFAKKKEFLPQIGLFFFGYLSKVDYVERKRPKEFSRLNFYGYMQNIKTGVDLTLNIAPRFFTINHFEKSVLQQKPTAVLRTQEQYRLRRFIDNIQKKTYLRTSENIDNPGSFYSDTIDFYLIRNRKLFRRTVGLRLNMQVLLAFQKLLKGFFNTSSLSLKYFRRFLGSILRQYQRAVLKDFDKYKQLNVQYLSFAYMLTNFIGCSSKKRKKHSVLFNLFKPITLRFIKYNFSFMRKKNRRLFVFLLNKYNKFISELKNRINKPFFYRSKHRRGFVMKTTSRRYKKSIRNYGMFLSKRLQIQTPFDKKKPQDLVHNTKHFVSFFDAFKTGKSRGEIKGIIARIGHVYKAISSNSKMEQVNMFDFPYTKSYLNSSSLRFSHSLYVNKYLKKLFTYLNEWRDFNTMNINKLLPFNIHRLFLNVFSKYSRHGVALSGFVKSLRNWRLRYLKLQSPIYNLVFSPYRKIIRNIQFNIVTQHGVNLCSVWPGLVIKRPEEIVMEGQEFKYTYLRYIKPKRAKQQFTAKILAARHASNILYSNLRMRPGLLRLVIKRPLDILSRTVVDTFFPPYLVNQSSSHKYKIDMKEKESKSLSYHMRKSRFKLSKLSSRTKVNIRDDIKDYVLRSKSLDEKYIFLIRNFLLGDILCHNVKKLNIIKYCFFVLNKKLRALRKVILASLKFLDSRNLSRIVIYIGKITSIFKKQIKQLAMIFFMNILDHAKFGVKSKLRQYFIRFKNKPMHYKNLLNLVKRDTYLTKSKRVLLLRYLKAIKSKKRAFLLFRKKSRNKFKVYRELYKLSFTKFIKYITVIGITLSPKVSFGSYDKPRKKRRI